jgi:hypothetical protein
MALSSNSSITKTKQKERLKILLLAGHQWLMAIILATWEAEIRRIPVSGQSRQIVLKTSSAE